MYDVIIIGKGPAGISASLYTKRANLNTLVIGNSEGALGKTEKIENYYGFENPINGRELVEKGIKQAENLGVELVTKQVTGIEYNNSYTVKTIDKDYETKSIIIATGTNRNKSKIPGINEFEGKGISYCAICDGYFFRGKDVAVLGAGEYAISEAEILEQLASSVTILTNGKEPIEVRNDNIKCIDKEIEKFEGNEQKIEKVRFKDNSTMDITGVFVAEGVATSTDLAKKIGIQTKNNTIVVNSEMKTNVPGIFAAGDCTGGLLQISKAIYEGAKAGLSAINYVKNI